MDGRAHLKVRSAYVVPPDKFNMPAQPPPPPFCDGSQHTNLNGINLEAVTAENVSILLGANPPEAVYTSK